jgi:hypothetical protein
MEVLTEVVKTVLLDKMNSYSSLHSCIEHEFKSRIKTQRGIDSIVLLSDYQSLLEYCHVTDLTVDACNSLLYTIATKLIETDIKNEYKNSV